MFLNSVREEMNQYNQRNCSKKCAVNSGLQEVDDFEITNGPEKGKIKLNGFVNGIAVDSTHHQTKNSKKKTKTEPNQHIINTFAESEVKHAQDEKRPEFQSISNGKRKDSKSSTGTKPKKNHSEVNSDPKDTLPINCSESSKCKLNEGKCCVKDFEARTLISAVEEIKLHDDVSKKEQKTDSSLPIQYVQYESELQMPMIVKLIQKDLSEPYSIYTYRYFIHNWPKLCFLAMSETRCVGAIVCKLDLHRDTRRGYIAMLAVDENYRKRGIGSTLVRKAIQEMVEGDAEEVVLETEITNKPALQLYEALGFVRDKRLFRYYLNGVDALRLKLWLR